MYGTVDKICEQLRATYPADETLALIIWTEQDVRDYADDISITVSEAEAILEKIDGLCDQHENGVSMDTIQILAESLREELQYAKQVAVPSAAFEKVLSVAGEFFRITDIQLGEAASGRLYPQEAKALEQIREALKR